MLRVHLHLLHLSSVVGQSEVLHDAKGLLYNAVAPASNKNPCHRFAPATHAAIYGGGGGQRTLSGKDEGKVQRTVAGSAKVSCSRTAVWPLRHPMLS